jgi:DNA-binding NarL/FixJ family response regulator
LATGRKAAAEVSSELAPPQVAEPASLDQLTQRQVEVLRLVARGMTNAEIADALFLSRRTVHAHLRTIFHRLGVANRSAATRFAIQHGLL